MLNPFQPEPEGKGLSMAGSQNGLGVMLRLSALLGCSTPQPQLRSASAPAKTAHVQLHSLGKVPRRMGTWGTARPGAGRHMGHAKGFCLCLVKAAVGRSG